MPLKILFIGAEVAPFAKTGGLGDVVGSLPKALRRLGHDVRVVMPAYRTVETDFYAGRGGWKVWSTGLQVPLRGGLIPAGVFETTLPGSDVPVYAIARRDLFDRERIYGYDDDAYRFAFLSRAALDLTVAAMKWRPDLVHAHDWHTAPAVLWLATTGQYDDRYRDIPTVYTIHNLAHQGMVRDDVLQYLNILTPRINEEPAGTVNLMARGILHSTMVNTVSPTYAREIMTSENGARLDHLLRFRSYDVHGILNGIDYDEWNPETDPKIPQHFDVNHLAEKKANKRALQDRLGLPRKDVPLVAMVTRLDWQKGLDITGHVIHQLMNNLAGDAQFVVLGTGADEYENMFSQLAAYHRTKMRALLTYAGDFAHLIYAASDMFVMPSRFEPCGLGQLIAMRYGTIPVVRATGGLADTVREMRSGFTFYDYSADAFWRALQKATFIYNADPESWRALQRNAMNQNYSWDTSARSYQQLYEWAIARQRGW